MDVKRDGASKCKGRRSQRRGKLVRLVGVEACMECIFWHGVFGEVGGGTASTIVVLRYRQDVAVGDGEGGV